VPELQERVLPAQPEIAVETRGLELAAFGRGHDRAAWFSPVRAVTEAARDRERLDIGECLLQPFRRVPELQFDAPVERTWALLMDTEAIAACLPGCRGLRPAGDHRYEVDLGVAIAAISGDFKGTVALLYLVPPQSYTLAIEGTGAPASSRAVRWSRSKPPGSARS
jgi:hypothetical protein